MAKEDLERPFTGWVSELARSHTPRLAGVARREGLLADDALDAVQEAFHTFLGLPQARALVADEEGSRALLSVLVRNAARNMRRRAFRARPHDALDDHLDLALDLPPADELIARAEEHATLLGCVSQLGEVQRNVVTLRMLEELSGEATAARLGLTPGHVAVLLHRAKRDLAACVRGPEPAQVAAPSGGRSGPGRGRARRS
ncbi:MAG: hypothetical protein DIJKHBIC_04721 [Thermoanaerobaculia bacterium]|nr:hypothetical protein [Thermoanaerobaculia bacterium]